MRPLLLALALLLPACARSGGPPAEPVPRNDALLEVHDLRDLLSGAPGRDPVFTSREAAVLWAERSLVESCWSEGVPVTEWTGDGILAVRAVPAAQERLAAALRALRESL